eukprot:PhM_4_TR17253/c0_g1_i1/m.26429
MPKGKSRFEIDGLRRAVSKMIVHVIPPLQISPPPSPPPRTVIVGDVHGCNTELHMLLEKIIFRQGVDRLCHVGDLVAKGPDSSGVIDTMMRLGAVGVLGNHDWTVLRFAGVAGAPPMPDMTKPTPHNKLSRVGEEGALRADQLQYLAGLPHMLRFPEYNVAVVHAAVDPTPGIDIADTNAYDSMHGRTWKKGLQDDGVTFDDADGLHECFDGGPAWATVYGGPEHVVFGHDAKRKLQRERFATGLDTGAAYGFKLSALVLPSMEVVSVDSLTSHTRVSTSTAATTVSDIKS